MDLKQCKYFVSVVENGSISKAAKKLHMAQPPLSIAMKSLEEELNCSLFQRGRRTITLSEAGIKFYARAKQLLHHADQMINDFTSYESLQGALTIGLASSVTDFILSSIQSFHTENPYVTFSLIEDNTYHLLDILDSEGIELAVVRTPYQEQNVDSKFIFSEGFGALSSLQISRTLPEKITSFSQLNNKPIIIYRRWEKILIEHFSSEHIQPNIILTCDDARTAVSVAKTGLGIAIVPNSIINNHHEVQLEKIDFDKKLISSEIHLLKKKNRTLSKVAEAFYRSF